MAVTSMLCEFLAHPGYREDFLVLASVDSGLDPSVTLSRTAGLSLLSPFSV